MMIYIGVDPGTGVGAKAGGIAVLSPEWSKVWSMPSLKLQHGRGTDHKKLRHIIYNMFHNARAHNYGEPEVAENEVERYELEVKTRDNMIATIETPLFHIRHGGNKLWENYGCVKQCLTDHYVETYDITCDTWQKIIFGKSFQQISKEMGKTIFKMQYPHMIFSKAHDEIAYGRLHSADLITSKGSYHTGACVAICIAEAGRRFHESPSQN